MAQGAALQCLEPSVIPLDYPGTSETLYLNNSVSALLHCHGPTSQAS